MFFSKLCVRKIQKSLDVSSDYFLALLCYKPSPKSHMQLKKISTIQNIAFVEDFLMPIYSKLKILAGFFLNYKEVHSG